jgi:hypothetical protein
VLTQWLRVFVGSENNQRVDRDVHRLVSLRRWSAQESYDDQCQTGPPKDAGRETLISETQDDSGRNCRNGQSEGQTHSSPRQDVLTLVGSFETIGLSPIHQVAVLLLSLGIREGSLGTILDDATQPLKLVRRDEWGRPLFELLTRESHLYRFLGRSSRKPGRG